MSNESPLPIELGSDEDGDLHRLHAKRNLYHRADAVCGCNPDYMDNVGPWGAPPPEGEPPGWWSHHSFDEEQSDDAP